jgi:hypothetical protein
VDLEEAPEEGRLADGQLARREARRACVRR